MSDASTKPGRTVDLTVDIDATLDEVWHALTTGEGIARWFAPFANVTPGQGGSVGVGWDPNEIWDAPITVWEPLKRLQVTREKLRELLSKSDRSEDLEHLLEDILKDKDALQHLSEEIKSREGSN